MAQPMLVVLNPVAGGGHAARMIGWIEGRIESEPTARLRITTRRGEAEEIARAARSDGHERVIVIGGDGTVQEVVNGLLSGADPPELGLVPAGSGNDLARSLAIPRDRDAAWTLAIGGAAHGLDACRARNGEGRDRWFASASGLGFDAQVAAAMADRRGWQAGRAGYLLTTLSELRRFENQHVRLTVDGEVVEQDVLLVAIANGEYYGGGMRIAPGAATDDGRAVVCIVGDISRLTALRQLPNLYRGTHVRHPAVRILRGARIEVDGDATTRVHLDGEPFGGLPMRVDVHAGALRVAAPR